MKPMPEDWERAVAVVAHPDELEYGAASAIARWTRQGKTVSYLLATRGEAGIAGMAPAEVAPLRVEEERRSAAVVGVTEVEFLDHVAGLVEYGIPLRRDLAAAFRSCARGRHQRASSDLGWGGSGQPLRSPGCWPGCPRRVPGRGKRVGLPEAGPRPRPSRTPTCWQR